MSIHEKSFDEMSESFLQAFGCSNNKNYEHSLPLYEKVIVQDKSNFVALNNIAVAKLYLAIQKREIGLIENAISDLKEAVRIALEVYKYEYGYPIAEANLVWAEIELKKLS